MGLFLLQPNPLALTKAPARGFFNLLDEGGLDEEPPFDGACAARGERPKAGPEGASAKRE